MKTKKSIGGGPMFKNAVRKRRQELGLSLTKLAQLVGTAESTLSNIELGKWQPWPKIRRDLARTLGVKERELFPDDQKPEEIDG
jgi:transcriptional regulator with XRE-family HTH domain